MGREDDVSDSLLGDVTTLVRVMAPFAERVDGREGAEGEEEARWARATRGRAMGAIERVLVGEGGAARTLNGRNASAASTSTIGGGRKGRDADGEAEKNAMYVRLCEVDGSDERARAVDGVIEALERSAAASDSIRRLVFALSDTRRRDASTARSGSGVEVFGSVDALGQTCGVPVSGTPDCGRLRSTRPDALFGAGETSEASTYTVPTLRHGSVFGAITSVDDIEEDVEAATRSMPLATSELDMVVAEESANRENDENAVAWLAAAEVMATTSSKGACWDETSTAVRELASALDSTRFDAAYRSVFRAVKGLESEPTIASESDCSHVAMAALGGCQASSDIICAVASGANGTRMRFTASSSLAFRHALKITAPAAERRCELDFILEQMTTPYMRPVASSVRDILRAHKLALQSMPQVVMERRDAERDNDALTQKCADVTVLELTAHTKRLRRQIDVIFNMLTEKKFAETKLVSHAKLLRRLETSLSHVEDEETPMIQYMYAKAVKPVFDDTLAWMFHAASSGSTSDFYIGCSCDWAQLRIFEEYRSGRDRPYWLGGKVHDGEDEDAEMDSLNLACLRPGYLPALVAHEANDVLNIGLQLRILQRLPQTRAFACEVGGAFAEVSAFEAHTERDARQWLNRVRLLGSKVMTLARESLDSMRTAREQRASEVEAARLEAIAQAKSASIVREKARLDKLLAIERTKAAERKVALEELDEREQQRRTARETRIAEERAWLEHEEAEHRKAERQKADAKMEEKRMRLETENAKTQWFAWNKARLGLSEKRRAFVRRLEAEEEEGAIAALADAMRDGVKIKPSRLVIEPFVSSLSRREVDDKSGGDTTSDDALSNYVDLDEALDVSMERSESKESLKSPIALVMDQHDDTVALKDDTEKERALDVSNINPVVAQPFISTVSDPEYLGESCGAPLPLVLNQEMREIVARQSVTIGHYVSTVLLDHLALEAHLDAVLRFAMAGDMSFCDMLLQHMRELCFDAKVQMTRTVTVLLSKALEGAIDKIGSRDDFFCERLRMRERTDVLVTFNTESLNLCSAFECVYAVPWPVNLVFANVDEDFALAHTQSALFQIRYAAIAVKEVSALIHASSKSRVLMDSTQTNADLRSRRLRKYSAAVAALQHFVDALHGHVFEAIHVGARQTLFDELRDENGEIIPIGIHATCSVIDRFCAQAHAACFLRPVDTALKALIDDGLQLALDFRALFSSINEETLLADGDVFIAAQQIHAKFHTLMTQLCFRARITSSESARGLIHRLDFNEFYLSAAIDLEF